MSLQTAPIAETARPGQFVNIDCGTRPIDTCAHDSPDSWDSVREHLHADERIFLRRPFSIYRIAGDRIEIIYRVIGAGTLRLSRKDPGDLVKLLGPLGNLFTVPTGTTRAVLVGGGIGLPPLLFWAQALHEAGHRSILLYGVRHEAQVIGCAVDEFEKLSDEVQVALEQPSSQYRTGLVTHLAADRLAPGDVIYAVGPRPMLRATAELAEKTGHPCFLLMEERMACGIGVCLSCMQMTPSGYRRICIDGPVFDAKDVIWE